MLTKLREFQRQTEYSQLDIGGDELGTVVATESVVGETVGRDERECVEVRGTEVLIEWLGEETDVLVGWLGEETEMLDGWLGGETKVLIGWEVMIG